MKYNKGLFNNSTQNWIEQFNGLSMQIPVMDLHEHVRELEEKVKVLEMQQAALLEYPALSEAYKEYKLVEKLVLGDKNGNK